MSVSGLFDWLLDGAPGATSAAEVVQRLGAELVAGGVPLARIAAFVTTLHPDVAGRTFLWTPEAGVAVGELAYDRLRSAAFVHSPIARVLGNGTELRRRLADPAERDFPVLEELGVSGHTDYLALPMVFTTGQVHAIAFATKRAGGFSDTDLAAMRQVCRPLARIAEILAMRRTAGNLLSTYVGRNAGDRVLAGQIRRGDVEVLHAVIWFSDLRGFTPLSQRATPKEVVEALNQVFDCQVAAVHAAHGEVLKFIGDGMLAIFALAPGADVAARCADAVAAAVEAQRQLVATRADLAVGIALHVGEVAYGNVGGGGRLDFTAIGPAVNLAARLEGLTGKLGRPIVLSAELAAQLGGAVEPLGAFDLKGIAAAVDVFAPARGTPAR